ncbi:MAG: hypothetical protein IJS61_04800 [Firmicutes bacterium]|nr:hypothetical protein [Bacillota bacterium]
MFCAYCGKQIPDGSVCSCRSNAPINNQNQAPVQGGGNVPPVQPAQPVNTAPNQGFAPQGAPQGSVNMQQPFNYAPPQQSFDFNAFLNQVKGAIIKPVTAMEGEIRNDKKDIYPYVSAAIYGLLTLLLPLIEASMLSSGNELVGDIALKVGFFLLLDIVLCKLALGGLMVAVSGKTVNFIGALRAICVVSPLLTVSRIVYGLSMFLKSSILTFTIGMGFLYVSTGLIYKSFDISNNKKDKVFWAFVVFQLITILIHYVVLYELSGIKPLIQGMLSY